MSEISPIRWMSVGSEERKTPLGLHEWGHSFWKMISLLLLLMLLWVSSFLWGKSASASEIREAVKVEVEKELTPQMAAVTTSLTEIKSQIGQMQRDGAKRDEKLDRIMLQPRYASHN